MKSIVLTGLLSVFALTACKKDDQIAEKSLEQQKMEFQMRQLEIEKQKLAIEKEKIAYESQKKADSIAEVEKAKTAAANSRPQVIRETNTIYRDRPSSGSSSGSSANNGTSNLLELNPPKSAPVIISITLGAISLNVGASFTSSS